MNPVDVNKVGIYTITYNVTDKAGNKATATRTVKVTPDKTPPVITLIGDATVSIELGTAYKDKGATAIDNVDKNLTASIVKSGLVDSNKVGTYTITYNVTDKAGNKATVTRTVKVTPDKTPPVITLIGDTTVSIKLGTAYIDAGATAWDNIDGDISERITANPVDTDLVGTQTVEYQVTDSSGNRAEKTRTVIVTPVQLQAPKLTFESDLVKVDWSELAAKINSITYTKGTIYYATQSFAGLDSKNYHIPSLGSKSFTAKEAKQGLTSLSIAELKLGTTYHMVMVLHRNSDIVAFTPQQARIHLPLTLAQAPKLVSESGVVRVDWSALATQIANTDYDSATIYYSKKSFADLRVDGYKANVNNNGGGFKPFNPADKPASLTIKGLNSDTTYYMLIVVQQGTDIVAYSAQSSIVVDKTPPVITLKGDATVSIELGTAYTDAGATASDNIDGNITKLIKTVNPVDTSILGTQTVEYQVTDSSGNRAEKTRTVIVTPVQLQAPKLTFESDLVKVDWSELAAKINSITYTKGTIYYATQSFAGLDSKNYHIPSLGSKSFTAKEAKQGLTSLSIAELKLGTTYHMVMVLHRNSDIVAFTPQQARIDLTLALPQAPKLISGSGVVRVDWSELAAQIAKTDYDSATIYYSKDSFANLTVDNYAVNNNGGGLKSFKRSDKLTSLTITKLNSGTTYHMLMVVQQGSDIIAYSAQSSVKVKSPRLNDTGITWGGNYPQGNNADCSGNNEAGEDIIAQQDCSHGRDALAAAGKLDKVGGGAAGFDFTKLDDRGNDLAATATQWACVRDNVTGLVWEVKTDDGGIHNKDKKYRWGGKTALVNQKARDDGWRGEFFDDWDTLVDGSNIETLCGFNNWRVPSITELVTITHKGVYKPSIDSNYIPNTKRWYWSSSPTTDHSYGAWVVRFSDGNDSYSLRYDSNAVRLVRSGE